MTNESLGRRRFLGLATGAAIYGSVTPSLSPGREGFILGENTSVIQQQFHPFHAQRIVVLPSGAQLRYGSRCGHRSRKRLDEGIERIFMEHRARSSSMPMEKVESTFRIMDRMTEHYRVPELFDAWVLGLIGRETLGSTAIGGAGLVHQFQEGTQIRVDCPPVDWWLFLFPDGINWQAPNDEPVHALIGHVGRLTGGETGGVSMYPAWYLASCLGGAVDDWRRVSRMGRIGAARHLNEIVVRLLESQILKHDGGCHAQEVREPVRGLRHRTTRVRALRHQGHQAITRPASAQGRRATMIDTTKPSQEEDPHDQVLRMRQEAGSR